MIGLQLEFTEDNVIAITGGDMAPLLNKDPLPMYRAVAVKAGDILSFTRCRSGFRSYIAFAGGLDVPEVFGSRSTHIRCGFGGLDGRKLAANDVIPFLAPIATLPAMGVRQISQDLYPADNIVLRVIMGPQDDYFTEAGIQTFLTGTYVTTQEMDRLGVRLEGPEIEHSREAGIISDGVTFGSIQVPANGRPIVMLADRQSTGGYTKIATVISADIPLLAQATPGKKVSFRQISVEEAQKLYLEDREQIQTIRERILRASVPSKTGHTYVATVNGIQYRIQIQAITADEI